MRSPIYSPVVATGAALKYAKQEEKKWQRRKKSPNFVFIPFMGYVKRKEVPDWLFNLAKKIKNRKK